MVTGFIRDAMIEIVEFVKKSIDIINDDQVEQMIDVLIDAYKRGARILVMGAGRSGLVGRAFAMRLLHLGYQVAVLGETIVPRIKEKDIVVAISGSGRTKLIVTAAEAAKSVGMNSTQTFLQISLYTFLLFHAHFQSEWPYSKFLPFFLQVLQF